MYILRQYTVALHFCISRVEVFGMDGVRFAKGIARKVTDDNPESATR